MLSTNRGAVKTTVSVRSLKYRSHETIGYVAVRTQSIPTITRWFFLLFSFTLPFEAADLGFMSGSLSIPKISGFLFIISYLCYYNPLFWRQRTLPAIPTVLWWFLGYLVIYILNGLFISEEDFMSGFFSRLFTLVQLMVMFWIASRLLQEDKIAKGFLLAYSLGSVALALGSILDLPGFSETLDVRRGRSTALGDDPNNLAVLMAMAAVILIGLRLYKIHTRTISKTLLTVMTLPLFTVIVNSGSRSGVAAFMIGCSAYLMPIWYSKRRLAALVFATLGVVVLLYMVTTNPYFLERWQETYYEGNLAGREHITRVAIEMIAERPIFGWKPIELWHELNFRLGKWGERDAHNLFLHLLLEVGVVGAVPFFVGLWLCGLAAYKARNGTLGVLPLALLLTTLAANMALTHLTRKPFWLALALSAAAASTARRS